MMVQLSPVVVFALLYIFCGKQRVGKGVVGQIVSLTGFAVSVKLMHQKLSKQAPINFSWLRKCMYINMH